MGAEWVAGVNKASCACKYMPAPDPSCILGGPAPNPNCLCGLWMRSSCTDALHYVNRLMKSRWKVVGAVEAWGTIIEHEHGLRCQYATILGLLMPWNATSGMKDAVREASLIYDVPVFETSPALTIHTRASTKRSRASEEVTPRPSDQSKDSIFGGLNI